MNARKHGVFLLILLVGIFVRIIFMSYHGLSNDELSAWYRAGFTSWNEFWYFGVSHGDMHPVFYQALLWCWIRFFGDSDWIIRIPSLLFFVANMLLIYHIARKHFSDQSAYLPLILYLGSSFLIVNTTLARPYNSGSFFILLAFLSILEIAQSHKRSLKWIFVLMFAFLGAMLSHYFAFLTAAVLGLLALIMLENRKRLDVVIAGFLAVIAFLPHLTVTLHQLNRGGLQWLAPPSWNWFLQVVVQLMNNSVWLSLLLLLIVVIAIFKKNQAAKNTLAFRLAWLLFFCVLFLGYAVSYFFTPVLRELVVLFILPFPLMALGHVLQWSKQFSLAVGIMLLSHSFTSDSILGFHHFGDFKYLSKEINAIHAKFGYDSITHAANTNNVVYINYYIKEDLTEKIKNWDDPKTVNQLYARVQLAKTPYFLYVLNNAYHSEQFLEVIRSRYPIILLNKRFGNTRLLLFEQKVGAQNNTPIIQSKSSNAEFSADQTLAISSFKKTGKVFFITSKSKVEGVGPVYAVVTMERKGKQLMSGEFPTLYQTFDINQKFKGNTKIGNAYLGFELPASYQPSDVIKVFIWNPNRLSVWSGKWEIGQR